MTNFIKRRYEILKKLRWLARVISSLFIIGLAVILFGENFREVKIASSEWLGVLYFPVGVVLGYIVGWKYELVGGLISIASLVIYFFSYSIKVSGQIPNYAVFGIFLIPAILFVISGVYAHFAIGRLGNKISNQAIHR